MAEMWLYHGLARVMRGRPGAFVDAGVNVGHTLVKVKAIDPDRDVTILQLGGHPQVAAALGYEYTDPEELLAKP